MPLPFQRTMDVRSLNVDVDGNPADVSVSGSTDEANYVPGTTSGFPMMAAVDDTDSDAAAEGKVGIVRMTTARAMHVYVAGAATTPTVTDEAAFTAGSSAVALIACYADETSTDSVSEGNIGAPRMSLDRRIITLPYTGSPLSERVSNTDGASTAFTTFGATASIRNYITDVIVHNSHASTNGYVDLRDGTAGSVLATIPLPATGGAVIHFNTPIRTTANTALAFDVSAAISTIYLTVCGYKAA